MSKHLRRIFIPLGITRHWPLFLYISWKSSRLKLHLRIKAAARESPIDFSSLLPHFQLERDSCLLEKERSRWILIAGLSGKSQPRRRILIESLFEGGSIFSLNWSISCYCYSLLFFGMNMNFCKSRIYRKINYKQLFKIWKKNSAAVIAWAAQQGSLIPTVKLMGRERLYSPKLYSFNGYNYNKYSHIHCSLGMANLFSRHVSKKKRENPAEFRLKKNTRRKSIIKIIFAGGGKISP